MDEARETTTDLSGKIPEGAASAPESKPAQRRKRARRAAPDKDTPTTSPPAQTQRKARAQRPFPAAPFEESLSFAKALYEFASGQPVRRLSLFDHLGKSPESGPSRQLITNANKYGLIRGNYASDQLELTPDGLKAVDEDATLREQSKARIKLSIYDVEPFAKLYSRFSGNKLPVRSALIDATIEFGVPNDLSEEAVDTFIVNLRFVGLLKTLSGAERIISEEHLLESLPTVPIQRAPTSSSGQALVTAEHANFEATCFYITPIGGEGSEERKHSNLFLSSFIEPALEQFGLKVIRADKIDKPGIITRQIVDYVLRSRIVIADLSFHNPNVFYELALRHAIRKPVVQIIRNRDSIPFDISQMRTIIIDNTDIYTLLPMIETYRSEIATQVRRALDDASEMDTPISMYYPNLKVSFD